jgi:PIN domain nuclease of toxin-antitoxin system
MKLLLDTHVLLWFHAADKRLSQQTLSLVTSKENECWYSIVSLWEIAIKHGLGKLKLADDLPGTFKAMDASNLNRLSLTSAHVLDVADLPLHHRDPFDRMLIAQAKHEGMHLLTVDPHFAAYGVPVIAA